MSAGIFALVATLWSGMNQTEADEQLALGMILRAGAHAASDVPAYILPHRQCASVRA